MAVYLPGKNTDFKKSKNAYSGGAFNRNILFQPSKYKSLGRQGQVIAQTYSVHDTLGWLLYIFSFLGLLC